MSPQLPTVLLRAQSDERLVRLVACGSDRAFEALVERHRRPLLAYARRLAGESRAEDLVQGAFVAAWSELRDGREVQNVRAWLFRVVHNNAVNALKRASASDVPLAGDETHAALDVPSEVERRETVRLALGGIAALPEQQRTALLAVAVQGRRHREIGDQLGVSEGAVKMLIHRARTSVRAAATALTPWPLLTWAVGGRAAEAGAGSAAVSMLTGGAMKAATVAITAGAVATAGPPAVEAVRDAVGAGHGAGVTASATGEEIVATAPTPGGAARPPESAASPRAGEVRATGEPQAPAPPAAGPTDAPGPADAPAPASPPEPTPAPAQTVDEATTLPPSFLEPASDHPGLAEDEDDWIIVDEEPPDIAAGERPIPREGLPDDAGVQVDLPDPPEDEDDDDDEEAAPAASGGAPTP